MPNRHVENHWPHTAAQNETGEADSLTEATYETVRRELRRISPKTDLQIERALAHQPGDGLPPWLMETATIDRYAERTAPTCESSKHTKALQDTVAAALDAVHPELRHPAAIRLAKAITNPLGREIQAATGELPDPGEIAQHNWDVYSVPPWQILNEPKSHMLSRQLERTVNDWAANLLIKPETEHCYVIYEISILKHDLDWVKNDPAAQTGFIEALTVLDPALAQEMTRKADGSTGAAAELLSFIHDPRSNDPRPTDEILAAKARALCGAYDASTHGASQEHQLSMATAVVGFIEHYTHTQIDQVNQGNEANLNPASSSNPSGQKPPPARADRAYHTWNAGSTAMTRALLSKDTHNLAKAMDRQSQALELMRAPVMSADPED